MPKNSSAAFSQGIRRGDCHRFAPLSKDLANTTTSRFWQRSKQATEELHADFEAGENGDLAWLGEANAVLET